MPKQEVPRAMEEINRPLIETAPQPDSVYQVLADKVGFVPSLRKSDNVFQAKFVGASMLVLAVGFLFAPWFGSNDPWFLRLGLGAFSGLVAGALISGVILGFKNLIR